MSIKKVLVVYHYIALYRAAVFDSLNEVEDINFYFAASPTSNNDIEVIDFHSELNNYRTLKNKWFNKKYLWQKGLFSELRENNYDAVIFLGDPNFLTTWLCLYKLKNSKTKTFLWTHGFLGRTSKLKDYIKLKMYSLADGILLYGNEAKLDLVDAGVPESKLNVIYNSLDYKKQKLLRDRFTDVDAKKIREKLFINPNHLQLFFIGRLTEHKKLEMLIDSTKFLKEKNILVNVLFIGDGVAAEKLKKRVQGYQLQEQVFFYGKTHDEDELAGLICSSDVCVSPGEVGLTAMHSLAYGVPVITHDNRYKQMPEYEAVINGKTGLHFDYGSITSLSEAIIEAFKFKNKKYKQQCIDVIESKYNPETQALLIAKAMMENEKN